MDLHIYIARESPSSFAVDSSVTLQTDPTLLPLTADNFFALDPLNNFDHLSPCIYRYIALFPDHESVKQRIEESRKYEIDQEELAMRPIHRGWCRCTRCYMQHRNGQQLYEQDSSDRTSVLDDWMYDQMVITPNDPSVSLNPPVLASVAPAPVQPSLLLMMTSPSIPFRPSPLTRRPPLHHQTSSYVHMSNGQRQCHVYW